MKKTTHIASPQELTAYTEQVQSALVLADTIIANLIAAYRRNDTQEVMRMLGNMSRRQETTDQRVPALH